MVTGDGTLEFVILHEISHGLGPSYARTAAGKTDIREAIGPQYSGLEEAKADVTGMMCVKWLVDHGAIPKEKQRRNLCVVSSARLFARSASGSPKRTAQAAMMEFSYLTRAGRDSPQSSHEALRNRFHENPGRDRVAREGIARTGSHGRPRARRKLVQEIRRDAAGIDRGARKMLPTFPWTSIRTSISIRH